jgi:sodium transport system permease protein
MRGAGIRTVLRKELLDAARDRRSLFSALLFPLLGPLLVLFMLGAIADRERAAEHVTLPVVGADRAPSLIAHLVQSGIEVVDGPAEPEPAVRDGSVDLVLVIDETYPAQWNAGRPATVRLVVDGSRDDTRRAVSRVEQRIRAYSQQIGLLRLVARGVDPQLAQPIAVEEADVASGQKLAARVLGFVPMFVLLAAFIGGMNIAIDTTAGERERASLEPLLINPVPRRSIVLGKWVTAVVFGCAATALTLAMCVLALRLVPLSALGLRLEIGVVEIIGVLAASLPLAPLAAGLQLLVATFARSFKEAQTYLSLLIFLPMTPGVITSVHPVKSEIWMSFVPVLGQQVLLGDVLAAEAPPLWSFLVAGAAALVVGGACVEATARLFGRERIVYGR